MKKCFILSVLLLLGSLCSSQVSVVKLMCSGDTIAIEKSGTPSAGSPFEFDLSGLDCCELPKLVIRLGAEERDWSTPESSKQFDMPADTDAKLYFICGGKPKGSGMVKKNTSSDSNAQKKETIQWGNTIQDALQLSEWWKNWNRSNDTESKDNASQLLGKYKIIPSDFNNINYLKGYQAFTPAAAKQKSTDPSSKFEKTSNSEAVSLSGIFSPTLVIDALGKFAAKRFKEELTIAFLQKFRDSLMSPEYRELQMIFPRTFHTMVSADVFNYAQFYQSLHENAQTDLYNLPENIGTLVKAHKTDIEHDAAGREAYPAILASLDLARLLELGMSASSSIEFLAYQDYIDLQNPTVYTNTVRTLGILSKHLHNWEGTSPTGWADEKYLAQLVSDQDAFNFWMALVLKQEENDLRNISLSVGSTPNTTSLYDRLNTNLAINQLYYRGIIARFTEIQASSRSIATLSKADSLTKVDLFYKYSISTFKLLSSGLEMVKFIENNPSRNNDYVRLNQILITGQNLITFAHGKRYGDALSATIQIFKLIYPRFNPIGIQKPFALKTAKEKRQLARQASCQANKAYRKAKKARDPAIKKKALDNKTLANGINDTAKLEVKKARNADRDFVVSKAIAVVNDTNAYRRNKLYALLSRVDKYGNLLVSCANAKNSDELLATLEKVAAPVQSYRKKRGAGHFTAAINMYPGLAGGYEYQLNESGAITKTGGWAGAFTTPVGFSLDWGIGKKHSISAFISLVDIGAVTAFRLNDNTSLLPELKWKNVYAPGVYAMWGIGRTPLTLGIGGQYGPALRKVNKIDTSHFRFGVSLTVDVPIFIVNLGSKKR